MSTHVIDVRGETAVSAGTWRDARYVTVAAPNAYYLHLTAEQAEKLAAGLITHASKLREPSEIPSTPIMALIGNWQRQVAERRNLRDSMGTEGNRTYQAAYADGVDGCVHALKALLESRPADEDAMAEAQANPGRMVTMAPDIAKMAHLAESQGDPLRTIIP